MEPGSCTLGPRSDNILRLRTKSLIMFALRNLKKQRLTCRELKADSSSLKELEIDLYPAALMALLL